jgi:hypothetical protein
LVGLPVYNAGDAKGSIFVVGSNVFSGPPGHFFTSYEHGRILNSEPQLNSLNRRKIRPDSSLLARIFTALHPLHWQFY